jgi:hypothetical protein
VRRVLEAEYVDAGRENVDSEARLVDSEGQVRGSLRSRVQMERRRPAPRGGPVTVGSQARRQAPSSSEEALVDGLMKEMVKRGDSHAVSR